MATAAQLKKLRKKYGLGEYRRGSIRRRGKAGRKGKTKAALQKRRKRTPGKPTGRRNKRPTLGF